MAVISPSNGDAGKHSAAGPGSNLPMPQPRRARVRGCCAFPRQPDHTPSPPSTPLKRLFLSLVFLTSPILEKSSAPHTT